MLNEPRLFAQKQTPRIRPNPAARFAIGASHKRTFVGGPATSGQDRKRKVPYVGEALVFLKSYNQIVKALH